MITTVYLEATDSYPRLRLQFWPPKKRDGCGSLRAMTVEDMLFPALRLGKLSDPCDPEGSRLVATVARLAYERVRFVAQRYGGRVWAYPLGANDWNALVRAEATFGSDHPNAERELARLDAHPCEPTVDEVADGVRRVVERALVNAAKFSAASEGE